MKLRFRLDPWLPDPYYEPAGELVALSGNAEIGWFSFYHDRSAGMLHLESLRVNPAFRGKGIGTTLHKKLRTLVRQRWPWLQYATGEVTSAGALRLLAQVHGKPLYIADDIRRFSFEEALQCLPCLGCTDAEGNIDCSKGHLYANVWIGRGAPPKDHPWRNS